MEDGFFGPPKVQEAYTNTLILMENNILKTFGSVDDKNTPDFCSQSIKIEVLTLLKPF